MDKATASKIETFIQNWNMDFPDYPLEKEDLQKPHSVMEALFKIFSRLRIDTDKVLQKPPKEQMTENMVYYWDLIPVINMTRVVNSFVSTMNFNIHITHLIQPTILTSHSILLLLHHLVAFNESRMADVAPYEKELLSQPNKVVALEETKNNLLNLLNKIAEEKGQHAESLKKIDCDIKDFEEKLKSEKSDEEKQKLEVIQNENGHLKSLVEQAKADRDSIIAKLENMKAQRVYDAEDINAKVEEARQSLKEEEERLNSLRSTLAQKQNGVKNFLAIKPNLEIANNLLREITQLSDNMKDDTLNLSMDSQEGELKVLNNELNEVHAQWLELQAARKEAARRRQANQVKRQQEKMLAETILREAIEKEKQSREYVQKAAQRKQAIEKQIKQYESEKKEKIEELEKLKENFIIDLRSIDEILKKKMSETLKKLEDKFPNGSKLV